MQMAIRVMRKGEIAKFILPSRLAFGEQGSSDGTIPPFCPLVYEVEIIDVK
jgi:FKBP-type peptidyl-prolyl cis-trans isomerase